MLIAKIENNKVVALIDTDSPEKFEDYIEVPEHIPANADLRFYHDDFTPKTTEQLIADGLIEPPQEDESDPDPEPGPTHRTQFSVLEFRDRFTIDEQLAIRQAQMTDMEVGLVYDNFQAAQFIDIADPRVEAGIDLYVAKGLLDPERKPQLLEPELIEP